MLFISAFKFQDLTRFALQVINCHSFTISYSINDRGSCFIFLRVETYDANEHQPSKVGKRVRVAATSTVNLNVSAANLETLTETLVSWSRHNDLEQKSSRKRESGNHSAPPKRLPC